MQQTATVTGSRRVWVFKTNIILDKDVNSIAALLGGVAGITRCNIDREDIDNVLRVEAALPARHVTAIIINAGFFCEELPD